MSKIIITPEMVDVIAEIQQMEIFGEGFVQDVDTLIDKYLLNNDSESDTQAGLLERVQLVRDLRLYQSTLLKLFPIEQEGCQR